ncbi:transcriptional regulator GcvA [Sapientia aquatica]|uniref:Transcriptional regulator GcvA n=1 Tax=Sapientia aquatica TaxID=1549640 RepID=A0A4V3ATQ8_9BURK|nr:transcriptional regulator GcvA [Sapientia aquatica]TDK61169.1 transcriptional regulator GcvA [Sapientia aquatica]
MARRLPSLNSLRVFEVAARRLNFTRAAEELHVTNAAVSHQIKLLEDELGIELFQRKNNVLSLTEAGELYFPRIKEGFKIFQQATDMLLNGNNVLLRVGVPPSFGSKWLVPRLYRFINKHPHIRVEIVSEQDRNYSNCDISIDFRRTQFADFKIESFISTEVFPVCSPQLGMNLKSPTDLSRYTLLHEIRSMNDADYPSWEAWFAALGVAHNNARQGPLFTLALMAMQAAIDGHGIALGQSLLVEYDIAAGRLMRPFHLDSPLRLNYFLIYATDMVENPAFQAFHQWLLDEVKS